MLTLMALWVATNVGQAHSSPAEDHAGEARDRIQVVLAADGAPAPGGTAHLTFSATPQVVTPDLVINWVLPEGVTMKGQLVETMGGQTAGQTVKTEGDLTFAAPGTYKVGVTASFHPSSSMTFSASGVLFFVIDPYGSYVTDQNPDAHRPVTHGMEGEVATFTPSANLAPDSPNTDGCFTVTGHITRLDRPVTKNGYGTNVNIPVVNALVDIREEDIVFDDSYGTVLTDSNGDFSKSFCDDDGLFDDTLEIYVRLISERHNDGQIVYVEDSSYIDEKYEYDTAVHESTGGTINYNLNLDYDWSGIFNIIDAASMARNFWVDNGNSYDEDVEIHWEDGYGDDGSYFDPVFNEITVADDPSDPDQWDDPVLMHEWGHSADDYYSCDDNPGGDHFINVPVEDDELSWGEGYPDYYQSAVRAGYGMPDPSYYIDVDGTEMSGISVNLETYDIDQSDVSNTYNELAIAAALWDFIDTVSDGQDTVSYGHDIVQYVYTSDEFMDVAYGLFDDTCNFDTYMRGWIDAGYPSDAATAAVVMQNVGYTLPASTLFAASNSDAPAQVNANAYDAVDIYRWWNQLTYVADNSHSMTGPKYDAMKTLFAEAVNDLGANPLGTEFALEQFNNTSTTNQITFAGQFFPENLIDPINALSTNPAADAACEVYALRALAQAVDNKEKGDVWLFTDGDTYQTPSVEAMRQVLTDKQLRASIALMGLCSTLAEKPTGPITMDTLQALSPEEQQALMSDVIAHGQARTALGVTADDVPGGLVPYLLTAMNSGGQFLYVSDAQVADAADILRAQITNSAGAGRWSDYVSDQDTYRYDTLATFEYNWIDASDGVDHSNPDPDSYLTIALPAPFTFYGNAYSAVNVFENGYVTFGSHFTNANVNTTLPTAAEPNNSLYLYWDDIQPNFYVPLQSDDPNCCVTGHIYTKQAGDWFVIEYYDYLSYTPSAASNTFEILLNMTTGEIRYQYQIVPNGAASATLGLENANGSQGLQIYYNDVNGASNDMGYKITPAPAQPTKTYDVLVDSSMDAVGFLLTGYSGSFDPLLVTKPNGTPVSCADNGVYCLDLDLVQYVQVNANGLTGTWHATVGAGNTGEGTFAFTSFASSPIAVEGGFDHTLSVGGLHPILITLPNPSGITQVNGHFLTGGGNPFGGSFPFFDDGNHGDGRAGDGLFGSNPFTPPAAGNAFLRVTGQKNGETFERVDPSPYTFSPLEVTSLGPRDNFGGATFLPFEVTNYDTADHCYWVNYDAPEGWYIKFVLFPIVCVNAGQTTTINFETYMAPGTTNDLPSGTTGKITISLTEWEKGEISDSDTSQITRHRSAASITIFNPSKYIRPNGDTVELEILVLDDQNVPVADGTLISLLANDGDIIADGTTSGGILRVEYTSGPNVGTDTVKATVVSTGIFATTDINVQEPEADKITLNLSSNFAKPDGVSQVILTATVTDKWGDPVAGQEVHLGVEGDAQFGTIEGGEVAVGVTDANGQFSAVYTSGETLGVAGVRAELYFDQGNGDEVVAFDRKEIRLGAMVLLPIVVK